MKSVLFAIIVLSLVLAPAARADFSVIVTMNKLRPTIGELQPFSAAVSTNFPHPMFGESSFAANVGVRGFSPQFTQTPVSFVVQSTLQPPSTVFGPTEIPSVMFATNIHPEIGQGFVFFSGSIPLKELPTGPVAGSGIGIPLRDMDAYFDP